MCQNNWLCKRGGAGVQILARDLSTGSEVTATNSQLGQFEMVLPGEMWARVDGGLLTLGPPGPPAFRLAGELGDREQDEGYVPQRPRPLATAACWRGPGLDAAANLYPPHIRDLTAAPVGSLACCPRRPRQLERVDTGAKVCFNQLPSRRANFKTWSSLGQLSTPKRWPEVRVRWQGHGVSLLQVPLGLGQCSKRGDCCELGIHLTTICYKYSY